MVSFLVLIIQIWLFTGAMLALHYYSPRIGLTPFFFYIAAIIAILNFAELLALFIEPFPGIIIRTGAHVFIPLLLTAILVLYIANGTSPAQLVLYALTGVNLLVLVVLIFLVIYVALSDTTSPIGGFLMTSELINLQFLRGIIASIVTFFLNMFLIVIVYQGVQNLLSKIPIWVNVSIALVIALWMDSILYNLLANLGTPNFQLLLPGDVLAKTLFALVISPVLSYYLIAHAPKLPSFRGNEKRPTFDVLFGVFGGVKKTLALLQQQMSEQEQALILARERVTLLQDMVRDASHDLKSPITSLLVKIHLLERVTDEKTRARHLTELKDQSHQLSVLIDELFTLSRLDSNRFVDKQLMNLSEIGRATYQIFYPIAEQNNLRLEFTHPDTPIWYEGFADELERIFLNLVGNAIRYTPAGHVSFSVSEDEDSVFITVKDTGIGIHHDDIPHIFTRFFRAKTASERGIRGTGLGLPIVKTVVDLHNGSIDIKSTVGVGTVITVSLPKTPQLHQV